MPCFNSFARGSLLSSSPSSSGRKKDDHSFAFSRSRNTRSAKFRASPGKRANGQSLTRNKSSGRRSGQTEEEVNVSVERGDACLIVMWQQLQHLPYSPGGLVLPFQSLAVVFCDVQYYVDTPLEMKNKGFTEKSFSSFLASQVHSDLAH
ncbi:ABC transporter G family member 33, partial [Mucuna pruriens]